MESSSEASVPRPILRFGTAGSPLLILTEHLVSPGAGVALKSSAVPARGFPLCSFLPSTRRRDLSACYFPNNPKDAGRRSGEERSLGVSANPAQALLGVGAPTRVFPYLPHDLSDNPIPPSQPVFFV